MKTLASLVITACVLGGVDAPPENTLRDTFRDQAFALEDRVRTNVARDFLGALEHLPGVGDRPPVWYDSVTREAMTDEAMRALPEGAPERDGFVALPVSDSLYYQRLFGTPALYARAIDLASAHGVTSLDEARVLDFGFGHVGHLRAMASIGARCVGIEVSELFEAVYTDPRDTGLIERHPGTEGGPPGTLRLVFGSWPGDPAVRERVGGRFDLIVTKNVLKRGYIYPEREADPSQLIDLGVSDEVFLGALFEALEPGGVMVLYNFSPKQAPEDEPYMPWADGRCPFGERQWREAGFEVLAHDQDDTTEAIEHFVAVGAGEREGLEGNLFGMYTVVRRPAE